LAKASRKYHSLNRDALKLIDDAGGLFMTCTCSAAMTQKEGGTYFLQTVQQASLAARREITLLRVSGAAPCHTQSPVSFPAGNYLTAAVFYVHAKE
jgi:23S rRNA G2069 N7-methylase RlmK/C1962 C5-methylase RlmI